MTLDCGPSRQNAWGVLEDRIERLRKKADRLEALLKAIPKDLPKEAEEALWSLVVNCHKNEFF